MGSTLIYYQRVPTDGARRLGCAGILVLCCRLPASGLLRPEARWPDKVLFSAEKSGALRAKAASRLMACGPGGGGLWCLWWFPSGEGCRGGLKTGAFCVILNWKEFILSKGPRKGTP